VTRLTLQVNGALHRITLTEEPDTPLAYVLRNGLGLTGTRIGCAMEQCGACAVLVDGRAALSCSAPATAFEGRAITTIEGIAATPLGARVQAAFVEAGAAQCGYCIPGIVVSITALLGAEPAPSREQVLEALGTHLCRCGTHPRILAAIDALTAGEPS
jgi:aerobic-type carbon monoxide dehydrogenase small subunit (CoxS/CutS family)